MDNKWTPEPWPESKELEGYFYLTEADYIRARECVNPLAGVENPEHFVGIGKNYINEDKLIRKLINADENERTYDEVERLMKQREELAESVKRLSAIIQNHMNV